MVIQLKFLGKASTLQFKNSPGNLWAEDNLKYFMPIWAEKEIFVSPDNQMVNNTILTPVIQQLKF